MINTNIVINDWGDYMGTGRTEYWEEYNYYDGINERVTDITPFGGTDVVWQSSGTLSTSRGGFQNDLYVDNIWYWQIDPTKDYRFSIYVNRKVIDGGSSVYFGWTCYTDDGTGIQTYQLSTSTWVSYTYFYLDITCDFNEDEWYLMVGYLHNANYTGEIDPDFYGRVYDMDGNNVFSRDIDYMMSGTTDHIRMRVYGPYSGKDTYQYFQPRLEVLNGTEIPLEDLFGGQSKLILNDEKINLYNFNNPSINEKRLAIGNYKNE